MKVTRFVIFRSCYVYIFCVEHYRESENFMQTQDFIEVGQLCFIFFDQLLSTNL